MATKHYRAAGGVVVQSGVLPELDSDVTHVLLLDRPARAEVRLPKGHIDPGENAREAALRETQEESGYGDIEIEADLGESTVEFDYRGDHYVRKEHYFLMRLRSGAWIGQAESDAEQFQVRWVPLAQAAQMLTYPAERRRIEQARQKLDSV